MRSTPPQIGVTHYRAVGAERTECGRSPLIAYTSPRRGEVDCDDCRAAMLHEFELNPQSSLGLCVCGQGRVGVRHPHEFVRRAIIVHRSASNTCVCGLERSHYVHMQAAA